MKKIYADSGTGGESPGWCVNWRTLTLFSAMIFLMGQFSFARSVFQTSYNSSGAVSLNSDVSSDWNSVMEQTAVQTTTVASPMGTGIIGSGAMNTNGSGADPVDRYYAYFRFQIVYTAAELSGIGMSAGDNLDGLGWSISEGGFTLNNYTLKIGHTSAVNCAANIVSGDLTTVKNPFSYATVNQSAGNFQMIPFDSNFTWNGTSNIVVEICSGSNSFTSPYGGLRADSMTSGSRFVRSDGSAQCATNTNTANSYRPQVQFSYAQGFACEGTPDPGNTIASVANACAGVNFNLTLQNSTGGSGVTYQWQSSDDMIFSNPTNLGTNSTQATSQSSAKYYRCIVTCSESGQSGTSNQVFVGQNPANQCYCTPTTTGGNTYYISKFTTTGGDTNIDNSSAGSATGYQDFFATTGMSAGKSSTFNYSITVAGGGTYGYAVWIDFDQDGTFSAGEQVVTTVSYGSSPKTGTITIPLNATSGETRMRVLTSYTPGNPSNPCTNSGSGEYEDYKITILAPPSCPSPTALTATTGFTSANLGWTSDGNLFDLEWGTQGFTQGSGTMVNGIDTNSYALNGLSASTAYAYYVRRDCGNGDTSTWAGPFNFTTQMKASSPWNEGFATSSWPAGWANTSMYLSSSIAALSGSSTYYIYKNLYSGTPNGNFTTLWIGELGSNDRLKFSYKLANYSSPYAPPAEGSGNFKVEMQTFPDGAWTVLETVSNNAVAGWQDKSYDLSAYSGQIVKFRITSTWTSGDYYIGFDNFDVGEPLNNCDGTPDGGTATSNMESGQSGSVVNFAVSGYTTGVEGLTSNWEYSTDHGETWTSTGVATDNVNFTITGPNGTVFTVRYAVGCSFSGENGYSNEVSFTVDNTNCVPVYSTGCTLSDYIKEFTVNGENETSISRTNGSCDGSYVDNRAQSVDLFSESSYAGHITAGTSGDKVTIWLIDANWNATLVTPTTAANDGAGSDFNMNIPDMSSGTYTMRVMLTYYNAPADECTPVSSYGQTIDYTVNIVSSICPNLSAAPENVIFDDSIVNEDCTVDGGVFYAPENACPEGSHIQYSVNGGDTWSNNLPLYKLNKPMTVITRCSCDADEGIVSPASAPVTTNPGDISACSENSYYASSEISPSEAGWIEGEDGYYQIGKTVKFKANQNDGYKFTNWTVNDEVVSVKKAYKFNITEDTHAVANFTPKDYKVITKSYPGAGGITTGAGTYAYGSEVYVSAEANEGYEFVNWTDIDGNIVSTSEGYSFNITGKVKLTANFAKRSFTVTTSSSPEEGGTTTGGDTYLFGTKATVTATANTGYKFLNWTIDGTEVSVKKTFKFNVTGDTDIVANFVQIGGGGEEKGSESDIFSFNYYPNPVKDILNIDTNRNVQSVEVYNLASQKVMSLNAAKVANGKVDVRALPQGVYVFRAIFDNGEIKTFKVVKK